MKTAYAVLVKNLMFFVKSLFSKPNYSLNLKRSSWQKDYSKEKEVSYQVH